MIEKWNQVYSKSLINKFLICTILAMRIFRKETKSTYCAVSIDLMRGDLLFNYPVEIFIYFLSADCLHYFFRCWRMSMLQTVFGCWAPCQIVKSFPKFGDAPQKKIWTLLISAISGVITKKISPTHRLRQFTQPPPPPVTQPIYPPQPVVATTIKFTTSSISASFIWVWSS